MGKRVQATPESNTLGWESTTATNPNSTNIQYGPNDPALISLLTCAGTLGLTPSNNADVKGLCNRCPDYSSGTTALNACTS